MSRLIIAFLASALIVVTFGSAGADSNSPSSGNKAEDTGSQEVLRAYLQLQEQLHATQLAIEQNRRESREAAAQNEEVLANRLHGIEQALAAQRARELDAMQSSNRVMLVVAGSFAGVGFIAMLIMAYFQWRTVSGLAEISSILPAARALGPVPPLAALGPGDGHTQSVGVAEQSNARLIGALEQLEKRLFELEHSVQKPLAEANSGKPGPERAETGGSNGNGGQNVAAPAGERGTPLPSEASSQDSKLRILLKEGETLLNSDRPEAALACFEEALAVAPNDAEALVKKGAALERLQKLNEAIECYDRAIATDASMTIAYLHKGGLCNRLERFNDALECYEKALRTQEKREAKSAKTD